MERRVFLALGTGAFVGTLAACAVNEFRQDTNLGKLNFDPQKIRLVADRPENEAIEIYNYYDLTWSGRDSRIDTIDQRNDFLRGVKPFSGPDSSLAGWLKTGIELDSIGYALGREGGYKRYQQRYSMMRVVESEALAPIRGQFGIDGLNPYFSDPDKVKFFYVFERYTRIV